jgi:NADH-quinone oxidoreductase subunit G
LLFLIGQDNLNINKKNEFIIYIGSHGDRGAEVADIILPGAAYTEQTAHYTNLEGKIQKAHKASYPPGEAKEDWQIINELAESMNNRQLFNDKDELISSMINFVKLKNKNSVSEIINLDKDNFEDEILKIETKDYYFSNVVARASKTMIDCNNSKINFKSTGTEG